jgi:hypothetical protein
MLRGHVPSPEKRRARNTKRPPAKNPGRVALRVAKTTGEVAVALTAIVGLGVAIISVVGGDDPPPKRGGDVVVTSAQPGVPLGEFVRRKKTAGSPFPTDRGIPKQLTGTIVEFRLTTEGFRGARLRTRWSLFDAKRHTQERTAPQADAIRIDADRDSYTDFTWIQDPRRPGVWYATVELYDDHGVLLDSERTRRFRTS